MCCFSYPLRGIFSWQPVWIKTMGGILLGRLFPLVIARRPPPSALKATVQNGNSHPTLSKWPQLLTYSVLCGFQTSSCLSDFLRECLHQTFPLETVKLWCWLTYLRPPSLKLQWDLISMVSRMFGHYAILDLKFILLFPVRHLRPGVTPTKTNNPEGTEKF
jgi:hypothetical protein